MNDVVRKALVIGIDAYPEGHRLAGCVNDAFEISRLLEKNYDESPMFTVEELVAPPSEINADTVEEKLNWLFGGEAETVVFYFAGHGANDSNSNETYLVTPDQAKSGRGVSLNSLIGRANKAWPAIKSTVILLDCCHAGYVGELAGLNQSTSTIGQGVTILAASLRDQEAQESGGHGLFTSIIIEGLSGSAAADAVGRVTPAGLYAYVDQTFGVGNQRPAFKTNVQKLVLLRMAKPNVPKEVVRRLVNYFETETAHHQLGPECEPDRDQYAEQHKNVEVDPIREKTYRELQLLCRNGLVAPTPPLEYMWDAAMKEGTCQLTDMGRHFHRQVRNNQI